MSRKLVRSVVFEPYAEGMGPVFALAMFDTKRRGEYGKNVIGYRLMMGDAVLFEGEDYYAHDAPDSDEAIRGIMCFLTLRPGDTDEEYFASYTEEQRDYCAAHAEALSCEVMNRFGED